MSLHSLVRRLLKTMVTLLVVIHGPMVTAAVTDLASAPVATSTTAVVRPNVMFTLDDSGSMNWNFMPDYIGWSNTDYKCRRYNSSSSGTSTVCHGSENSTNSSPAPSEGGDPPFYSNQFNGVYYSPAVSYTPPIDPCNLAQKLPAMSSANTSGWTAVPILGHEIDSSCNQTSGTSNLAAAYPELVYCNSTSASTTGSGCKRNGIDHVGSSTGGYDFPNNSRSGGTSYVNWYDTFGSNPVAGTYKYAKTRAGNPHYYTITPIEYCSDANLTSCQAASSNAFPVPAYVRFCKSSAFASDTAVVSGNSGTTSKCQSKFSTTYKYARYGSFSRTDIAPTTTSYPKAGSRIDCAGASCTYAEEMTNFANWYAYYRTRVQMMKSAAGLAFTTIGDSYRVGFVTINPGSPVGAGDYLKIAQFNDAQKKDWYLKLYAQNPTGGTPLREALSRVGRYFANKTTGINQGMSDDPMAELLADGSTEKYACRQNFTLLTTDGYWNGNEGVKLDGTTAIGNQDNANSGYSTRTIGAYDGALSGSTDTLADVAMYYYKTDLRSDLADQVPTTSKDPAPHQHMTSFTLGLGVDGQLSYRSNYESATTGDFSNIKSGTANWPVPVADTLTAIDDLWHAAVNGHGSYFSARDPASLTSGLQSALAGITARTGAAAASATSSPNITQTDHYIYSSTYRTLYWDGEVVAQTIDTQTGAVSASNVWSAQTNLDGMVTATTDSRNIYKYDATAVGKIEPALWSNLDGTEQAFFGSKCTLLSQCGSLTAAAQTLANNGQELLEFVRGQNGNEGSEVQTDKPFRDRQHVLGDTVNATPAYVRAPRFNFADSVTPGYGVFKANHASRQGMLYIPGNDGMLHALNGDTGVEAWAYIPKVVMPNLYRLADKNYGANHGFYVDGSPQVMDVYDVNSSSWKSILVAGLNSGGRGYYALDITDPAAPKALWEFCYDSSYCAAADADLGYSYGTPVIGKLPAGNAHAGKWVVMVTSGYNNVGGAASGKGYLFVLDAISGAVLDKIPTNVGDNTTPSGLAKISGWSDNANQNATVTQVYGGDLLGNVWRFDLTQNPAAASRLATLYDGSGNIQPVTAKVELGKVAGVNDHVVFVGTGRYLGTTDLANSLTQSVYAIRDKGVTWSDVRTFTQRTITHSGNTATAVGNVVDWSTGGWFADFPDAGERVNIDPQLVLGTLILVTNIPESNACSVGGSSWIYQFDYLTGMALPVGTTTALGSKSQAGITVGFVVFRLPTGQLKAVVTDAGGGKTTIPINTNPAGTLSRRSGWRELVR